MWTIRVRLHTMPPGKAAILHQGSENPLEALSTSKAPNETSLAGPYSRTQSPSKDVGAESPYLQGKSGLHSEPQNLGATLGSDPESLDSYGELTRRLQQRRSKGR